MTQPPDPTVNDQPTATPDANEPGANSPRSCAARGSALALKDIMPGRCYEAKRPARIGYPPRYNDRQVKWVSSRLTEVQYDSPTVAVGRRYPIVSMAKFLKWAGRDVTAIMPKGEWRGWRK